MDNGIAYIVLCLNCMIVPLLCFAIGRWSAGIKFRKPWTKPDVTLVFNNTGPTARRPIAPPRPKDDAVGYGKQ